MTASHSKPPASPAPPPSGLRIRIWIGCLAGSAVAALGLVWIAGEFSPPDLSIDPVLVAMLPWAVAGLGILSGIGLALWLDHHIVGRLRELARATAGEPAEELSRLRPGAAWGELAPLTRGVQRLWARIESLAAEAREARLGRQELERAIELEREARERGRESVLEVRAGVLRGLEEAREIESQAERGFVEATALLTTVRELQRLRGELEQALAPPAAPAGATPPPSEPAADAVERYRAAAVAAIEELVGASSASVERLAAGLGRVQEISDRVHTLANRATLVALEAAIGATGEPGVAPPAERADELRRLAADILAVTERTSELAREVDREVAAAVDRMRAMRDRVGATLESVPAPAPGAIARARGPEPASPEARLEQAIRLLDRVREMIQDAMQKGERLSAAGERASSSAQRLVRRLEEEVPALEALVSRESPEGARREPEGEKFGPGGLRLLEPEDIAPDAEPPVSGMEGSS